MAKKTKADPTGQRGNRKKITAQLSTRLTRAQRKIKKAFQAIPRRTRNVKPVVNKVVYTYDIEPDRLEDFNLVIDSIINDELGTKTEKLPPEWWYKDSIESPYRQGTLEETIEFNQLIAAAAAAGLLTRFGTTPQRITPELVLTSQPYIKGLNNVYVRNYGLIKSLSNTTANQVIQNINSGIQAGKTPTEISALINERFNVSRSNAHRIVSTEVNRAYNDSRMDALNGAVEQSGLRAGVIHISALTNTTRAEHAARHGNAYTVEDQTEWWNTGANRINCKCTTQSILIDASGEVVEREERDQIREEGREFFAQ